jgi:hypothetical protein
MNRDWLAVPYGIGIVLLLWVFAVAILASAGAS